MQFKYNQPISFQFQLCKRQ